MAVFYACYAECSGFVITELAKANPMWKHLSVFSGEKLLISSLVEALSCETELYISRLLPIDSKNKVSLLASKSLLEETAAQKLI
jgi:hypothetical protein